jgi:hypothetical protein
LAFQEAAGNAGSLFFCLSLESSMRALILIAGAPILALAACGNNDQTDNTQNVDENLTAENIVSNDVTAIDAVTGDAANMAADVDLNYGNLGNAADETANESSPKPKKPAPKSAPRPAETPSAAATNAE